MYPVMGESMFRFDWVQDSVTDLDVNLVTIGLPGGSGTSVKSKKMYDKPDKNIEVSTFSSFVAPRPDAIIYGTV